MILRLTTTIHPDYINNEDVLDYYDFDNTEFNFYFRVEHSGSIEVDGREMIAGGEELELVMITDEHNNEVDFELDDFIIEDIYNENCEEGVNSTLPLNPMGYKEFFEITALLDTRTRNYNNIESILQAPFPSEVPVIIAA